MAKHKFHKRAFDDSCPVCTHENRDIIEYLYTHWAYRGKRAPLCRQFVIKDADLVAHVETLGLSVTRSKNTYELIGALLDAKLQKLDPDDIAVRDLVNLIKHVDTREGRITHKVEEIRPKVVPVLPSPSPGFQPPEMSPSSEDDDTLH